MATPPRDEEGLSTLLHRLNDEALAQLAQEERARPTQGASGGAPAAGRGLLLALLGVASRACGGIAALGEAMQAAGQEAERQRNPVEALMRAAAERDRATLLAQGSPQEPPSAPPTLPTPPRPEDMQPERPRRRPPPRPEA